MIIQDKTILPEPGEIRKWLLETIRHSCHIEYYLGILGIECDSAERPHDIAGRFNKLEWDVIKGCALEYSNHKNEYSAEIQAAIGQSVRLHRGQNHHKLWNGGFWKASREEKMLGALDISCALRENRPYYTRKGIYVSSFDELGENIDKVIMCENPEERMRKIPIIKDVVRMIKGLAEPQIMLIESIERIPNIGLNEKTYSQIRRRRDEALDMLAKKGVLYY